ncbi:LysE family translocator [Pseudomonas sp. GD04058]|uniref:LysE family translocator n=1 Tax=Pseudomonas sp. GD04058 TaxID=2975429 RepID=UPI0024481FD8|nr:LysE family transporter [Pseudomonas sp. GD04058]MDG9886630.1 LysE family translocator [Pseudomonas sp. GD04058]
MLFVKSLVIGFSIAAPVGPIGLLCVQRSLKRGFRSGLATGLGAASADTLYGFLGAIGITGIAVSAPSLVVFLKVVGGAFLVWLAWSITRDALKPRQAAQVPATAAVTRDFLTAFGLTLSNPMTILAFIAIFAALDPLAVEHQQEGRALWLATVPMLCGVFLGSAAWWLCLSGLTAVLRKKMSVSFMRGISAVSAVVIGTFGLVQVFNGLRDVF